VTASLLIAALLALRASGAAAESAGGAREPRDSEEIEPPLVAYLAERARSEGTPQVVPIYGAHAHAA